MQRHKEIPGIKEGSVGSFKRKLIKITITLFPLCVNDFLLTEYPSNGTSKVATHA
jgi:hypothetical protein